MVAPASEFSPVCALGHVLFGGFLGDRNLVEMHKCRSMHTDGTVMEQQNKRVR